MKRKLLLFPVLAATSACVSTAPTGDTHQRYAAQVEGVPGVQRVEIEADEEYGAARVWIGNRQLPLVAIPRGALTRLSESRYEFRLEQGVAVPITILGNGRFELTMGERPITISLAMQAAEAPAQGVQQQHQEVAPAVVILYVGAVGAVLVATCGAMATWSCGWRGVQSWSVYSYTAGLCAVQCW